MSHTDDRTGSISPFSIEQGDSSEDRLRAITAPDLRAVRVVLASRGLPAELVAQIVAGASYYPTVKAERTLYDAVRVGECPERDPQGCAARLCILGPPVPSGGPGETCVVRRVTWTLAWQIGRRRDEGWADWYGQVQGNPVYSFLACIFRPLAASVWVADTGADADGGGSATSTAVSDAPTLDGLRDETYCEPDRVRALLGPLGYAIVPNDGRSPEDAAPFHTWDIQHNDGPAYSNVRKCLRVEWDAQRDDSRGFLAALRPGDRVGLWFCARSRHGLVSLNEGSVDIMYEPY
ncbi:hypothetical protein BD413DRAFT_607750 [Trametes elegans]|nr:hypothetical protein BD413DRAFT_607750 [Trametes elegans]